MCVWVTQYLCLESLVFGPVYQQELWCVCSHFGTSTSGCLVCSCLHVCAGKAVVPESPPACQLETDFGTKHKSYPYFWTVCAHVVPGIQPHQPHPPETWLMEGEREMEAGLGREQKVPCVVLGFQRAGGSLQLPSHGMGAPWPSHGCWGCPHLPARGWCAQPARPAGRPLIDALGRELPSCPRRKQEGWGDSARLSFSVPAS